MEIKDIIDAIKRAEEKTGAEFMSWDLGKWIEFRWGDKKTRVSFDVIHEDELDRGIKFRLYKFVEAIEEELMKIGAKKATFGFVNDLVVPVNGFDLRDAYYALCQEEYKAFWGKEADDLDEFSVFLNY